MYNNTFGNIFRLTSFGESHGKAIGGVIDGFPAGITIDEDFIQQELNRRRPGQSSITTSRKEADAVEFLSGIYEGVSTGCPIGFVVWNTNQHSSDYDNMKDIYRPSHADYTYTQKYGLRDHRGGGRSSARETIARVVGGALAKLALKQLGIHVTAFTSQVGIYRLDKDYTQYDLSNIEKNPVRCPDPELAKIMEEYIFNIKGEGDTVGGVIHQGRRRYRRRCHLLCHQRLSCRTGTTGVRETSCSIRKCHAKHQRRERIRIRTRIRQHEPERKPTE